MNETAEAEVSPNGQQVENERLENLVVALSSLAGRSRFAQKAGLQYGGKRNIFKTAGYVKEGQEKFEDYWSLYQRGDIAGRIVDMAPNTTWKHAPEVKQGYPEKEDPPDESAFEDDFNALQKRLRLWHRLNRADRLSRIGRYGVILIGVRGVGDDRELAQPLGQLNGPDDVIYLSVFHEKDAKIETWVKDTGDERFGFPETYKLRLSEGVPGFPDTEAIVHHSRIIHVAEDPLDNEVFGRPVLKRALNRLFDLEKVAAATAEAYWQLADKILTGKVDQDVDFKEEEILELGERLEEIIHSLRRQFVGKGIELDWLDSQPPNPGQAADLYFMLIAAAVGIPKRILFGTETGERASEQDERAWHGVVSERQEHHAEPNLLRSLVDRLVSHGALPDPGEYGYEVYWPPLKEESDSERSNANLNRARTAKELTPVGGDPREMIDIDDEGNVWLKMPEDFGESEIPDEDGGPPEAEDDQGGEESGEEDEAGDSSPASIQDDSEEEEQ